MNDASTPELQHRTDSSGHRLVLHPSGGYVSVPVDFVPTPVSSPQNERLCKYSGTRCANRQQRQLGPSSSEAADLPEPIPVSVNSPDPPLDEWEADLLLETMQDS
ncbi:hypothetical protein PR001_g14702 [Phytophthora rubi]|uniref:Uncharacterized protein n=1 Tax=Phytophthora rubi TaxID=129364 RepID=A0A6A3LA24_9STRA|nr:hypothetical protein PR001_g14702 [Phytophthora rubi]